MLTKNRIINLFELLNSELKNQNEIGEVCIVGGAAMCLVFQAREATKDIDAIFAPTKIIRQIVRKIAQDEKLPPDWLNDAAKGFIQEHFGRQEILSLSNLRVWAPDARYLLAMKCISARIDTSDKDDVLFLIKHLALDKAKDVFSIIQKYYPKNQIPAKTKFFIEEILQ